MVSKVVMEEVILLMVEQEEVTTIHLATTGETMITVRDIMAGDNRTGALMEETEETGDMATTRRGMIMSSRGAKTKIG